MNYASVLILNHVQWFVQPQGKEICLLLDPTHPPGQVRQLSVPFGSYVHEGQYNEPGGPVAGPTSLSALDDLRPRLYHH